jgi:hypothetical protein
LGSQYLLPYDASLYEPSVKGISIQELKNLFMNSKVNNTAIIIFDCCYSGMTTDSHGGLGEVERLNDLLRLEGTGIGRFVLVSAGPDARAREERQKHADGGDEHVHGRFSFNLIEALGGAAADVRGLVSLGAVIRYVFRYPYGRPMLHTAGTDMDGIWLTRAPFIKSPRGKIEFDR